MSDELLLARIAEDFIGKMIPADIFDEAQRLGISGWKGAITNQHKNSPCETFAGVVPGDRRAVLGNI